MNKRPWNRINSTIYSVSSNSKNGSSNMNIVSYVTSISMSPKRYLCGLYKNDLTLDYVLENKVLVLQLLSAKQVNLVSLLGKKSGRNVNKISRLSKRHLITEWSGFKILTDSLSLVKLKVLKHFDAGDHIALLLDVIEYKNVNEGEPLTLEHLRQKKIIRA